MNCSGRSGKCCATRPSERPKHAVQAEDDEVAVAAGEPGAQGFELAFAAKAFLLAGFQLVADAVADNVAETLGGVDAETEDEDFLSGLPVLQNFIHDGGEFGMLRVVALFTISNKKIEVEASCLRFLQGLLDAAAFGAFVQRGVAAGEVAAQRRPALAALHFGDATHE